jgi:hypothetical protein
MTHNRYPRIILDIFYQGVTSPWDDEVDVLVQIKQGGNFCAGLNGLYVGVREGGLGETP